MTTKEKLIEMCISRGKFDDQAKEVVELSIPKINELVKDYKITWDRPASEYPESVFNAMFVTVRKVAEKWIDENVPLAWYKPLFTSNGNKP